MYSSGNVGFRRLEPLEVSTRMLEPAPDYPARRAVCWGTFGQYSSVDHASSLRAESFVNLMTYRISWPDLQRSSRRVQ
jgi:hypothetical protein